MRVCDTFSFVFMQQKMLAFQSLFLTAWHLSLSGPAKSHRARTVFRIYVPKTDSIQTLA